MKKLVVLFLTAVIATGVAFAKSDKGNSDKQGKDAHGLATGLLPQSVVDKLNLTAEQKTKLDNAWTAFNTANPNWAADMKKARDNKDKDAAKALMTTRRAAVQEWATCLTDEQKATLAASRQQHQDKKDKGNQKGNK